MAATAEMHSRVKRGVAWTGGSQVALQLIRLAGAVAVARLLTPGEYGLAMLALVFASLVLVFSDLALGAALVQRKELSERDRSTAFWVTIAGGTVFTLGGVLLSGPVASLYGEPDVQPLLAALSASFLLTSLGATQQALLLRDMAFGRLELHDAGGDHRRRRGGRRGRRDRRGAVGDHRPAVGRPPIVSSVLFWAVVAVAPDGCVFSRASMRDLWGFSGYLVGHRLLFYLHQNADSFLIGRAVGAAGARRLRRGLQRDAAPAQPHRRPDPAGAGAGLLANAGRA